MPRMKTETDEECLAASFCSDPRPPRNPWSHLFSQVVWLESWLMAKSESTSQRTFHESITAGRQIVPLVDGWL